MGNWSDAMDGGAGAAATALGKAPPRRERVLGVDATRCVALLGMFGVHVTETLRSDTTPSHTQQFVAGHALATFVLLAGVSLAFTTGRKPAAEGGRWPDRGTAAALAMRGALVGVLGLVLHLTDPPADVILPYYGAMFVLAIPLVRLASRTLTLLSAALMVVAPLVVLGSFGVDLTDDEPTLTSLIHPITVIAPLLVSGSYPAVETWRSSASDSFSAGWTSHRLALPPGSPAAARRWDWRPGSPPAYCCCGSADWPGWGPQRPLA
jgi:hypothetical protein